MAAAEGAAQLTVNLAPSDYNGYGISCFGLKDGAINATISGGTPPYTYFWSNGATTEDLSGIPAGYYRLDVLDADSMTGGAQITLVEPTAMRVAAVPHSYPNGYNISCHECFNGSIDVTVTDGVPPYSYDWGDEVYSQDRTGLGSLAYQVTVTDANGCNVNSERITLTQPERSDWRMDGNANTDPALHYFGTSDAQDAVFKSNGQERLRLIADGQLKITSPGIGPGVVYIDENGVLRGGGNGFPPNEPPMPVEPCAEELGGLKYWNTSGNSFMHPQCDPSVVPLLGTLTPTPLSVITSGEERIRITTAGRIGIGNADPTDQFEVHHTDETGGMRLTNGSTGSAHSEIRFFHRANQRWSLGCDLNSNGGQDFFLWDEVSQAPRIYVNDMGKVGIGTMPPANSNSLYRLYVGDGIATRDVKVTAQSWPDYVFAQGYELMPLASLRQHLIDHRHLPWLPSSAEIEANGGYEVGDMQGRLLRTVEEQALYILHLMERLELLESILDKNLGKD